MTVDVGLFDDPEEHVKALVPLANVLWICYLVSYRLHNHFLRYGGIRCVLRPCLTLLPGRRVCYGVRILASELGSSSAWTCYRVSFRAAILLSLSTKTRLLR